MMKITRDVILDMWPVYVAGEASADTRALVDEFLREDPEFASTLKRGPDLAAVPVSLPPDAEARAFAQTRALVRGREWLHAVRVLALVFTAILVIRVFSDNPQDRTGRILLTAVTWAIYAALWCWQRRKAVRATMPRHEG
jgi:hypothetical protein